MKAATLAKKLIEAGFTVHAIDALTVDTDAAVHINSGLQVQIDGRNLQIVLQVDGAFVFGESTKKFDELNQYLRGYLNKKTPMFPVGSMVRHSMGREGEKQTFLGKIIYNDGVRCEFIVTQVIARQENAPEIPGGGFTVDKAKIAGFTAFEMDTDEIMLLTQEDALNIAKEIRTMPRNPIRDLGYVTVLHLPDGRLIVQTMTGLRDVNPLNEIDLQECYSTVADFCVAYEV